MITFVKFKNMTIKIDRPEEIMHRDKDICNRTYELLKGTKEEDKWTREMDEIFKKHNIKYELAKEEEYKEFLKTVTDFTLRL